MEYRRVMIMWRNNEPDKFKKPSVCTECYGWDSFGGRCSENVTLGPMCVCDKTWIRVHKYLKTKKYFRI